MVRRPEVGWFTSATRQGPMGDPGWTLFQKSSKGGLFTWCWRVLGNFEGCTRFFLWEYSNRAVIRHGDCESLLSHSLNVIIDRDLFEFYHAGLVSGVLEH